MKIYLIPNVLAENSNHLLPATLTTIIPEINYFLVENERTARRFLGSLKLGIVIRDLHFKVLNKGTKMSQVKNMFQDIPEGSNVGIISEAGVPCVADPGHVAVTLAHQKGWKVIPISGPSSILLALMGSGMSGQKFKFHGYLPIKPAEASKAIKKLEKDSQYGETQIFMETPYRNNKLFELLLKHCSSETRLCVACNLTAEDEFIKTKRVGNWKLSDIDLHKKPTIFLIGGS